MNVKLLKKVKAAILKEPKQFQIKRWFSKRRRTPNCGTAACIGGWAVALNFKMKPSQAAGIINYHGSGKEDPDKALGITIHQGERLFLLHNWPEKFQNNYKKHSEFKNAAHNAKVAAARIDHFLKTKGAE